MLHGISLFGKEACESCRPPHEENHLSVQVDEEGSQEATRDPATWSRRFVQLHNMDMAYVMCVGATAGQKRNNTLTHAPFYFKMQNNNKS